MIPLREAPVSPLLADILTALAVAAAIFALCLLGA